VEHSVLLQKLHFCCFLLLCVTLCYGQRLEIRPTVYGGLFFYHGSGATATSNVHLSDIGYYNSTSYGKKSDVSYTFELPAQWISRQNHILGLGLAFERLTSKATVDSVFGDWVPPTSATGKVTITNTFLTLNPFVGHRFLAGSVALDGLIGMEWAWHLTAPQEEAEVVTPFKSISKLRKKRIPNDLRARAQVNASYKRMGLSLGYSRGTENQYFYDNRDFKDKKAYANFIRFGISYRLK